jgi:hypothetical protein
VYYEIVMKKLLQTMFPFPWRYYLEVVVGTGLLVALAWGYASAEWGVGLVITATVVGMTVRYHRGVTMYVPQPMTKPKR